MMDWSEVPALLERWRRDRDPVAGRVVFTFLEEELRLATPHGLAEGDDAIREVLAKLVGASAPPDVQDLKSYLVRSVRNGAIDLMRAKQRRKERDLGVPLSEGAERSRDPSPLETAVNRERDDFAAALATKVRRAMARLSAADRITLMLCECPEWLDDEDVAWLAARGGLSSSEVRVAITRAADVHDLTRIFDPGEDDPADPEARRKRMERFRKRRNRIAERVARLMSEED